MRVIGDDVNCDYNVNLTANESAWLFTFRELTMLGAVFAVYMMFEQLPWKHIKSSKEINHHKLNVSNSLLSI